MIDEQMLTYCTRWAAVWFGMARWAREHEYYTTGTRFQEAGEDIYDKLELRCGMKQCPVCYSGRVKEYKLEGIPELRCLNCGYDSGDKIRKDAAKRERERRERERQR